MASEHRGARPTKLLECPEEASRPYPSHASNSTIAISTIRLRESALAQSCRRDADAGEGVVEIHCPREVSISV
jgi:hypothetical protein